MRTPAREDVIVLRCFAYPGDLEGQHGYHAICVDLNLYSWRPTLRGAKVSLEQAIAGYLRTAAEQSDSFEEFRRLIHRPVPLSHRAKYYALLMSRGLMALAGTILMEPRPASFYEVPQQLPMQVPA